MLDTTGTEGDTHPSLQSIIDSMRELDDSITEPCEGGPYANFFNGNRAVQGGYASLVRPE